MWEFFNFTIVDTSSPMLESYRHIYIPFNIVEAVFWFGIGLFVLARYLRHRKTWYELQYSLSFTLFGFTDLIETHSTTVWLLCFKAACLLAILQGRKLVLTHYPAAKF